MTRREGTSKSNSVDATGSSHAKKGRTYFRDSHRKLNIARDPTSRFGWGGLEITHFFMLEPTVTTRGHEKNGFETKFQGPRSDMDDHDSHECTGGHVS